MKIHLKPSFPRPLITAAALGCFVSAAVAPAAQAQLFDLFNWNPSPPPQQIERMQRDDDPLAIPGRRHIRAYQADLLGRGGAPVWVFIDGHYERLPQPLTGHKAALRQAAIEEDTAGQPAPGRKDHFVAPRLPADVLETSKPKRQARRHEPEATPVAQPTTAPNNDKATSLVPPAAAPDATTPPRPDAASTRAVAPPANADAKAAVASSPAAAAIAPIPPAPKTSASKVNDVPVAPLE
jgi:hypothetical protein